MTSLKCNFLKNLLTDFSEILAEDVKLMTVKVLEVSRRYLPLFLNYRETTGGGNIYPPALRGLTLAGMGDYILGWSSLYNFLKMSGLTLISDAVFNADHDEIIKIYIFSKLGAPAHILGPIIT